MRRVMRVMRVRVQQEETDEGYAFSRDFSTLCRAKLLQFFDLP